MRPPPQGQVVINLKTTITAHGGHSGVIVHSGIQSASPYSYGSSSGSLWSLGPGSRIPQIETPGGTRLTEAVSPLALTIGPSTSQDHLNTSWTRPFPSPQPPQRSGSQDHLSYVPREYERRVVEAQRRPETPPSPVYDFTGRNTPPREFIEPSRITLNVFEPGRRTPVPYDVGLRQSNPATADALINDTVTTTTTVEVFRTPLDPTLPFVSLPPAPAPGLDDRPQLLRLDGPPYEKWSSTRSETLINDRPVVNKAVKWKEKLTDRNSEFEYEGNRLVDSRSPFANVSMPSRPSSASHQYYIPTVHHVDERLVPSMVNRSTSPYMIQSPSEFSTISHPIITNGHEDDRLRSGSIRGESALSYHQPIRTFESLSNTAQLREQPYVGVNGNTPILAQTSPVYVEPNRSRERAPHREVEVDRYGYSTVDRRTPRRAKSSHRGRTREEELRARSVSPLSRRPSWAEDPNRLPNMPRADSKDTFHLYETRDAFDNIVSQFSELEMFDMGAGLLLSPLAESEESIISETSARNDRARADLLENRPVSFDIYKIADQFYQARNPLMISKSADHIYERPRAKEIEEEHIYEELDTIREATSTSNLAQIYHTVANDYDYEEIPPPLPPRRREEEEKDMESETLEVDAPPPPIAKEALELPKLALKTLPQEEERPSKLHLPIGSSSEEEDPRRPIAPISDSGSNLSTTTADSSDSGDGLSFMDEEWPPPPQIFKRPRKAHPDGHVFPRITSSVYLMPRLPEDKEFSSSQDESGGISLTPLHLEVFDREPKPASPVFPIEAQSPLLNVAETVSDDKSPGSAGTVFEEEDLPFVDASPRVTSPNY